MLILDKDPILAARYLSIKDIKLYFNMAVHYSDESELLSLTKFKVFTRNNENYIWICKFLQEVANLYYSIFGETGKDRIIFPDYPDINEKKNLPNVMMYKQKDITFIGDRSDNDFKVATARYKYMLKGYKKKDFINNKYPEWYIPVETIVFETYLRSKRKYYRILLDENSNFVFEVSILGGVLKRMENIPEDIKDLIIATLLKGDLVVKNRDESNVIST